jgi:hypothetical protein
MIRNVKQHMEKNLASGSDKNNRKLARYFKSKKKIQSTIGPLVTANKRLITEEKEMAEELNKYFASVFTRESPDNVPEAEQQEIYTGMPRIDVTREQIKAKINYIRKDSAPGPDGITPLMLKELEASILEPLEIIFKKSLDNGDMWKTSTVTPIFIKGTKGNPGNFRPVSLASVPCKIREAIIKDSLKDHLLCNKLIRPSQLGFIPGKSCVSNRVELMDRVTKLVDEGTVVDNFYLDFPKAFNKVLRRQLVQKLKAKGVKPGILRWTDRWLTGWKQKVSIRGKLSGWGKVTSSVPQGTVLGPCYSQSLSRI